MQARGLLRSANPWQSVTPAQEWFFKNIYATAYREAANIPELKSLATNNIREAQQFFKQHKINMRVPSLGKDEFAALAALDVDVKWNESANPQVLKIGNQPYKSGLIKSGINRMSLMLPPLDFQPAHVDNPIVMIDTKIPHHQVLIYKSNRAPFSTLDLLVTVNNLVAKSRPVRLNDSLEVIYPLVNLEKDADITWLEGLRITDGYGKSSLLRKSLQKNKLNLSLDGARAQSGTAMIFSRGMRQSQGTPKRIIIDSPFYFAIVKKNLKFPLFSGYITPEDWIKE